MKVTDVLVQCLENEGVQYVFGMVGSETVDIADSFSKSKKIQFVNVELVGNIKSTLQLLSQVEIPRTPSENLRAEIAALYQINFSPSKESTLPFTIENILHKIEDLTPENSFVISDVGAHKVSIAKTFQPKKANRFIISNGLASMGISIPGSIGAKLAVPNEPVICITGDGGALMNFAEIETAKRLGLSFFGFVFIKKWHKKRKSLKDFFFFPF